MDTDIKKKFGDIIFETDSRLGKLFDVILLYVILLSVFTVMLDSVEVIHSRYGRLLAILEWSFTIIFTIEYILRIWVSRKTWGYVFSFWGVIDLLSVLPTYLSLVFTGVHYLIIIRILRVLRIFRVFKLSRYVREALELSRALRSSSRKITVFLLFVLAIVILMGALMYVVEGSSNGFRNIPESIYWAIVTVTTVGYGDITPQTFLGKLISSIAMILGYAIIAIPTGIVSVEIAKVTQKVNDKNCCDTCGHEHKEGDKYCSKCGEKLVGSKQ